MVPPCSHVTTALKRKTRDSLPEISKPGKIGRIAPTHASTPVSGTGKG